MGLPLKAIGVSAVVAGGLIGFLFMRWMVQDEPMAIQQPPAPKACLASLPVPTPANPHTNMVTLEGGRFMMAARALLPDEGPPRMVVVGAFMIDRTDVTNEQFAAFVAATGYRTLAERNGASAVFTGAGGMVDLNNPGLWWRNVNGANWRHPYGPGSTIEGRAHLPVVQIAFEDALAYAQWLGHDLPTEAEWEFAARAGAEGVRYVWGENPPGNSDANIWQGVFPLIDSGNDGYKAAPAPVGCYPPNAFGLYDMAGNVWQWTRDPWTAPDAASSSNASFGNAQQPGVTRNVIKGGSFLCADNFCLRYRPDARSGAEAGLGMSHIGFRTVVRTR